MSVQVACALPSDTTLSHASTVTLNVYGSEAAGGSNWSRACVRDNDSMDAAACGPTKSWGSGTRGVKNIDVSEWQAEPTHFPFVISKLDAGDSRSELFGIYMAN